MLKLIREATSKAEQVFLEHKFIITDPNNYRCDSLLMSIALKEKIVTESHPFSSDLCGMLYVDEYEKTIVYNSNQSPERRNFTIAHELGHYYLHLEKQSQFADRAQDILENTINEFEIQANAFASYLTLPDSILLNMINHRLSYYQIKKRVRISDAALFWRLVNYLIDNCAFSKARAINVVDEFKMCSMIKQENAFSSKPARIYSILSSQINVSRLTKLYDTFLHLNRNTSDF